MTLASYATMKVSQSRIADFLSMKELPKDERGSISKSSVMKDKKLAVLMNDVRVSWGTHASSSQSGSKGKTADGEKDKKDKKGTTTTTTTATTPLTTPTTPPTPPTPTIVLENINVQIGVGECVAVVGPVGAGKSAFCNTILHEMQMMNGSFDVNGTIAYAAQTAWILNASIKNNILFGNPYDEKRYKKVVAACQLTHDLAILDDGDDTMIGERGINLSGGQKQRVSVARAAYSNKVSS